MHYQSPSTEFFNEIEETISQTNSNSLIKSDNYAKEKNCENIKSARKQKESTKISSYSNMKNYITQKVKSQSKKVKSGFIKDKQSLCNKEYDKKNLAINRENYKKFNEKILAGKLDDTIDLSSLFLHDLESLSENNSFSSLATE